MSDNTILLEGSHTYGKLSNEDVKNTASTGDESWSTNGPPQSGFSQHRLTQLDLWNLKGEERMLLSPLLLRTGLHGCTGPPDVGKSTFSRQLALHIVRGESHFLGYPLSPKHKRVLFVSSEDSKFATKHATDKPSRSLSLTDDEAVNLVYLFTATMDTEEVIDAVTNELRTQQFDLVIFDCLGDLFVGNQLDSGDMRAFLKVFAALSEEFSVAILFVHHIRKSSYGGTPSHEDASGSASFVQKLRVVFDLRRNSSGELMLSVVKANHVPWADKNQALLLQREDSTGMIVSTGKTVPIDSFASRKGNRTNGRSKMHESCKTKQVFPFEQLFTAPNEQKTSKEIIEWLNTIQTTGKTVGYAIIKQAVANGKLLQHNSGKGFAYSLVQQ